MSDDNETGKTVDWTPPIAERPGDVLRKAREAAGMTLAQIGEKTRIPIRQLTALEANDFASMPAATYAIGFARTYAKLVGVDSAAIAADVRAEMGASRPVERFDTFEPIDAARVPPRWLAIGAAVFALLLIVGYGIWRSQIGTAPTDVELSQDAAPSAANAAAPAPPAASAQSPVVLTALNDVWLRITDQNGTRLYESQMLKGESYTVPASATNPVLMTGQPESIAVTVGGRPVPPLGEEGRTISDVPVSAAALLARPAVPAGEATNASAAAAPAASNAPAAPRTAAPAPRAAPARSAPPPRRTASPPPAASAPSTPALPAVTPAPAPAPAPSSPAPAQP